LEAHIQFMHQIRQNFLIPSPGKKKKKEIERDLAIDLVILSF